MNKFVFLFSFVVLATIVFSQTISFGLGDVELEASLNQININAKADMSGFSASLSVEWGIPEAQIKAIITPDLQPAEVYMAVALASLAKKPVSSVIASYKADRKAGWGALARSLGIKPGSPAFRALKDRSSAQSQRGRGRK